MSIVPPVHREILVDADPAAALPNGQQGGRVRGQFEVAAQHEQNCYSAQCVKPNIARPRFHPCVLGVTSVGIATV